MNEKFIPENNLNKENSDEDKESHSFQLWQKCFEEAKVSNFSPEIVRNASGDILAPNKEISKLPNEDLVKITRTPSFKLWFGDWINDPKNSSKVIYEETGESRLCYHASQNNILVEEGLNLIYGVGTSEYIYFTDIPLVAYNFALRDYVEISQKSLSKIGGDAQIYTAFLNIKNVSIASTNAELKSEIYKNNKIDGYIQKVGNLDFLEFQAMQFVVKNKNQIMHLPSSINQTSKT